MTKINNKENTNKSVTTTLHYTSSNIGNFIIYPSNDSFSNDTPIQYGEETDVDDL